VLGAVTGASIAANSGPYYGNSSYYGGYDAPAAYAAPAPYYAPPAVTYYQPAPVYVAPAVVYRPRPVYVQKTYVAPRYPVRAWGHDYGYKKYDGGHGHYGATGYGYGR